jgi:hypothetical protein
VARGLTASSIARPGARKPQRKVKQKGAAGRAHGLLYSE